MKIPFGHQIGGKEFCEKEIRELQSRVLKGEITESDRRDIDALLSFFALNHITR
jgi:hypothetical protein